MLRLVLIVHSHITDTQRSATRKKWAVFNLSGPFILLIFALEAPIDSNTSISLISYLPNKFRPEELLLYARYLLTRNERKGLTICQKMANAESNCSVDYVWFYASQMFAAAF